MAGSATITQVPSRAPHGPQGRDWAMPTPPETRTIPTDATEAYQLGWRDRGDTPPRQPRIPGAWLGVLAAFVVVVVGLGAFSALLLHELGAGAALDERMDKFEKRLDASEESDRKVQALLTLLVKNSK